MSAPYGGQQTTYPPYGGQQAPYPPYQTPGFENPPPYSQDGAKYPQHQDPNADSGPPPAFSQSAAMGGGLRAYTPDDIIEETANMNSFSDKSIRRAFIRKVYLIVTGQLLFTLVFVILFTLNSDIKRFLRTYSWVYWIAYGVFIVTYLVLVCVRAARRRVPINYICLSIFTAAFTYMTATIAGYYSTYIVLIALGITVAVCVGITIFAMQTKIDFTMCSGVIFVISIVVILFGLAVGLTFAFANVDQRTAMILQCVYGSVCAILFSIYLVFDTQMLMGDKKNAISEEEYVFAALQLYLDMVQIFLAILQVVGAVSK